MFSNSFAHYQKIKFLPLKVDHVFDLEEAVGLLEHRSAVSYINEKEGHVMLRELFTRLSIGRTSEDTKRLEISFFIGFWEYQINLGFLETAHLPLP